MKKNKILFLVLVCCFLLTGCGKARYRYYANYTDSEIYDLVDSYVKKETYGADNYSYKIIKTEPLEVCTFSWNVCHNYTIVKGAKKYTIELTNKTTGRKESQVFVKDRYYVGDELRTHNVESVNFSTNHKYYESYDKMENLLNNYSSLKYHLIDSQPKLNETKIIINGYIYSDNLSELERFLNYLINHQSYYHWDLIITNNITEYNELNNTNSYAGALELYNKTNKVYTLDLSSFNNNSNAIIENSSLGSSKSVTTVLTRK